ncbi:uncharacterized mitochondrial protein AtMg00860-like [Henckelia pumila]|uniref:uncharacterized mitochondrial protein AtMg00860-like n=1 Tax=Henckelia pumila TaxID=405737 RepID=UPI003C6E0E18
MGVPRAAAVRPAREGDAPPEKKEERRLQRRGRAGEDEAADHKFVVLFIDDILVYSRNLDEHAYHLRLILKTLRERKLYTKLSKCEFWIDHVVFLGHVIYSHGVSVDPSKIYVVLNWLHLTTVAKIRIFLGLAGYYLYFIANFSQLARPLTQLTRKGVTFEWSSDSEENFCELWRRLTSALVLALLLVLEGVLCILMLLCKD